jgi:hypothetical protein
VRNFGVRLPNLAENWRVNKEEANVQKKPRFTFVKMLVLFLACYPLALVLEGITNVRTPGAFIAAAFVDRFGKGGFSDLNYGIPIALVTDTVLCFLVILTIYKAICHLRSSDSEPTDRHRQNPSRGFLIVMLLLCGGFASARAQQSLLQIVSPADQTQVTHGQTITINVQADPSVQNVYVMGESPLPNVTRSSVANQFYLTIPNKISPRLLTITAMGQGSDGDVVYSQPITLDIERPDDPFVIFDSNGSRQYPPPPSTLHFEKVGDELDMQIFGIFTDGRGIDLTYSTKVTYVSQNPEIATVSPGPGIRNVKAVAPGETSIIVTAGTATFTYIAKVPLPKPTGPVPEVSSVQPNSGIPTVTQVTVYGSNFGDTQGSSTLLLGTREATSIASWSDTQIVATVPRGSMKGTVVVERNGITGSPIPFNTLAPKITSITPMSASAGREVVISGAYFGASQGDSILRFNVTPVRATTWSDTSIKATIPATAITGDVVLLVNDSPSNGIRLNMPPVIRDIQLAEGAPGTVVTVTGTNFSSIQDTSTISFNGVKVTPTRWTSTSIVVPVPATATSGNVVVTVNGVSSGEGNNFEVNSAGHPAITNNKRN